jgi:hypothetical protein
LPFLLHYNGNRRGDKKCRPCGAYQSFPASDA